MDLGPLFPFLVVALALAALIALVEWMFPAVALTTHALRCPLHGQEVRLGIRAAPDGSVRVVSCSAFIPPRSVRCDRRCACLVSGGQALRMRS